jgi:hypothetical protein
MITFICPYLEVETKKLHQNENKIRSTIFARTIYV